MHDAKPGHGPWRRAQRVSETLLLTGAVATNALGLAWFALAMDVHWRQAGNARPLTRRRTVLLRVLGALALSLSLLLCFHADHVTMAPLVWIMALAAGALAVALILAWHPRVLRPLVAWLSRALAS